MKTCNLSREILACNFLSFVECDPGERDFSRSGVESLLTGKQQVKITTNKWRVLSDLNISQFVRYAQISEIPNLLTEEIILKIFGSPVHYRNPDRSIECRGLRLLTWKFVGNFGDSRDNVFGMYSCENLLEIFVSRNDLKCDLCSSWYDDDDCFYYIFVTCEPRCLGPEMMSE